MLLSLLSLRPNDKEPVQYRRSHQAIRIFKSLQSAQESGPSSVTTMKGFTVLPWIFLLISVVISAATEDKDKSVEVDTTTSPDEVAPTEFRGLLEGRNSTDSDNEIIQPNPLSHRQ
ncbi:unnamed protein product, partial [Allacma fusca]